MDKLKNWVKGLFDTKRKKIIAAVIVVLMIGSAGLAVITTKEEAAPVSTQKAEEVKPGDTLQQTADKLEDQEQEMLEKNADDLTELDGYIR